MPAASTSRVQCGKISLAFGDRDVLKDVSLFLSGGTRAALAGANGSGKTTLLRIIAGIIKPDSGEIAAEKTCRISYLPQAGTPAATEALRGGNAGGAGRTLWEAAESAFDPMRELLMQMDEVGAQLEKATSDGGATAALLEKHHALHEEVESSGYYRRDALISAVLKGLGFGEADFRRRVEEFSGGWQMRIALAKILLENPDIMLLDEPTNYLDIEARSWLEDWLAKFPGGILLVSHDRYFLDVTVNEVYELFQGKCKRYAGNYSAYERIRQEEIDSLVKRYAEQQEEIAKAEDLIRRFRYKATKAAMVQERIKKLEKMERIEIPESLKKISIRFPAPPHSGRTAFTLSGIGKSYGERRVLSGLDLNLDAGEKLVVAGRNGAGKSTLLRIIAGVDDNYEGEVKYGTGIVAGYFSQESAEALDGSAAGATVLAFMEAAAPTALIPKVRDMLGGFLFRGDDVYKPLGVLSGGERSRLALLRLLLRPLNLLILDEPTNHLDLSSKDILLDALLAFTGTVVFVSHDRQFMEALSTKTLELKVPPETSADGAAGASAARLYYGGYGYYLERIASGEEITPNSANTANNEPAVSPQPAAAEPGGKNVLPPVILVKAGDARPLSAAEQREANKQRQTLLRRLEREEASILAGLEKLEAEKAALESELSLPEVYSNGERAKQVKAALAETTAAVDGKTAEWTEKAAELEAAKKT